MRSTIFADLPIIEYERLIKNEPRYRGTSRSTEERHKLYTALTECGFVYLRHPGISQEKVDELFLHSRRFFAKPLEEKTKILGKMHKGRGPSQGYSCPALLAADPTTSDIKEFFGIYRDDDSEKPNQWLDDPTSVDMRRDLVAFFESCRRVILELLSALAEEVGLVSGYLHPFVSDANHFIACLHYPATPKESFANRVRSAAHTDYGCMTLLFNDSGKGLQVMRHGKYEYVPRMNDCAVVNIGDLLSRFFNGVLPSTMHRVIEPPALSRTAGQQIPDRYSLAFFGHFNSDLLVKPLDALCSASRPAQFEPVLAGEHVKARVRQLHVAGHSLREKSPREDHVVTLEVSAS